VAKQRGFYKKKNLAGGRIEQLESIGFEWDCIRLVQEANGERWNQRFEELKQFHRANGHCDVPRRYPENHRLQPG
jgi:hypothetical protein